MLVVSQTLQTDSHESAPLPESVQVLSLFGPSVHLHAPLMQRLAFLHVVWLLPDEVDELLPPFDPPDVPEEPPDDELEQAKTEAEKRKRGRAQRVCMASR